MFPIKNLMILNRIRTILIVLIFAPCTKWLTDRRIIPIPNVTNRINYHQTRPDEIGRNWKFKEVHIYSKHSFVPQTRIKTVQVFRYQYSIIAVDAQRNKRTVYSTISFFTHASWIRQLNLYQKDVMPFLSLNNANGMTFHELFRILKTPRANLSLSPEPAYQQYFTITTEYTHTVAKQQHKKFQNLSYIEELNPNKKWKIQISYPLH